MASDDPWQMGLRVCCHTLRCDATNTNIWNKSKLHVIEVSSSLCKRALKDLIEDPYSCYNVLEERKIISPLQQLTKRSSNEKGILATVNKQVGAVVAEAWSHQVYEHVAKRRKLQL